MKINDIFEFFNDDNNDIYGEYSDGGYCIKYFNHTDDQLTFCFCGDILYKTHTIYEFTIECAHKTVDGDGDYIVSVLMYDNVLNIERFFGFMNNRKKYKPRTVCISHCSTINDFITICDFILA